MCCEHQVRSVKDLFRSYHTQLDLSLIKKSVMANNGVVTIKEHVLDCMVMGEHKSGGDHRHVFISVEEKRQIRGKLERMKMFREVDKEKVTYNIKVRRVWENLKCENIDMFLDRNCESYNRKKKYRFN